MGLHTLSVLTRDEMLFAHLRSVLAGCSLHRVANPRALDSLPAASLVLIDTAHPELPPFADARWRSWCGHLSVIVASSAPNDAEGLAALDTGAAGYCQAYAQGSLLTQVLDVVASGELWVGRNLLSRLIGNVGRTLHDRLPAAPEDWRAALTEREAEVASRAALGDSNADIALALGITERTVKAHLSAIFTKLKVADRLQLALRVHGIR